MGDSAGRIAAGFYPQALTGIVADLNLNTLTAPGAYVQNYNARCLTSLNYPVAGVCGSLFVRWNGAGTAAGCTQEFYLYNSNNSYRRYYLADAATWSAWVKISTQDDLIALGLKTASQRDVGTGLNQIPDMNSFIAQRGGSWYRQHPSGMLEQGGSFLVSGANGAQKYTINFPIPFPNVCVAIWFSYQTEDPSARFAGIYTKSLASFVSSIVCPTANTVYFKAEGY